MRLVAGLFAALVLATVGVLAGTQALRSQSDVITKLRLSGPVNPDEDKLGVIRFRLAETEPRGTLAIRDRDEETVVVLVDSEPLGPGRVRVRWDGTDAGGEPVSPGRYRVRLELDEQDREVTLPGRLQVLRSADAGEGT